MISPKTAQILKYCGLFLILLIFLSFELSVTLTVSFYLVLNSRNYTKLLIVSLGIFLADVIFRNFDISIRFISDLALDSYILLLISLFIYLKSQPRIVEYFKKLNISSRKIFSINSLLMLGVSSIFSLLLAPIVGIPFAVISGYLTFSYLSKHFEGRYAYAAGLFFLFFSPFFIMAKKDNISENLAIISFYLLIIGTVQETVRLVQKRREKPDGMLKITEKKSRTQEAVNKDVLKDSVERAKYFAFRMPKINFGLSEKLRPVMKLIVIAGITGLLSFAVISTIITPKTQKMNPTITTEPSVSPTIPTLTIDTGLELMVENGTEISGLAASTAARLKNAGFKNVDSGNAARSDYKNWEMILKKDDPALVNHIKNILRLEILTVNKASESAKFDLVIIAGSELP